MDFSTSASQSYGPVAKILHWLMFVLLAAQLVVGETMPHIGRNTKFEGLVAWHIWLGAAVLFFFVVRLGWRLIRPVPLLANTPVWERRLAHATHWLLYLTVILMTILGWAAANSRGWDVKLFGLVTLPPLAATGARWAHQAGDIHNFLVWPLVALVVLHAVAALYHYFIRRDQVLQRMMRFIR